MTTIFIGVKGVDNFDPKVPLVFVKDDADVKRWIEIEDKYMRGSFLDASRTINEHLKSKQKP